MQAYVTSTHADYHARNIMSCQVLCYTTLCPAFFLGCNVGSLQLVYCGCKAGLLPGVTAAKALLQRLTHGQKRR